MNEHSVLLPSLLLICGVIGFFLLFLGVAQSVAIVLIFVCGIGYLNLSRSGGSSDDNEKK